MQSIYPLVNEARPETGALVSFHGTVYKIRKMSGFAFVIVQTKRENIQCVWSEDFSDFPLSDLACNMAVIISGSKVADDRSKSGFEIRIKSVTVLSAPAAEAPVVINNKKLDVSLDTLLDYRPLTLRSNRERAIFKIQEGICRGFRLFFEKNDFTEIHSPKIVFSGAEGGANIFRLNYFDKEAFLAQSPQFYKQIMVGVFERVFEIGPVFRAERHHTSRHINEYTSVDAEIGFIESFTQIMETETRMIAETFEFLKENYSGELELAGVKVPEVTAIPALRFDEAKLLVSKTCNREITDTEDFDPEEEKLLCEAVKKETGSDFVFVTHYRDSKRPFYTMNTPNEPELTESFDLLFRGVEVTTGGQRIHDYYRQVEKMQKRAMTVSDFESYLMAHKYGLAPHGGFGLGLERFTARLLGLANVRQAALFPRDTQRLTP